MLTGSTWRGQGLDVQTTNGGVKIGMPEIMRPTSRRVPSTEDFEALCLHSM